MRAGLLTFKEEVIPTRIEVRQHETDPKFRYLLVESGGQEALVVWVGNEPNPLGEASVWISADGVVLRFVQGRLIGVSETRRSWQIRSELILSPENPLFSGTQYEQISDEQPNFRIGVVRKIQKLNLSTVPQPMLAIEKAQSLRWYEEIDSQSRKRLAVYGLDAHQQTIAGQRCIASDWCLRWQKWPVKVNTPAL